MIAFPVGWANALSLLLIHFFSWANAPSQLLTFHFLYRACMPRAYMPRAYMLISCIGPVCPGPICPEPICSYPVSGLYAQGLYAWSLYAHVFPFLFGQCATDVYSSFSSESKTQYSFVLRGCVSSILYRGPGTIILWPPFRLANNRDL